MFPSRENSTTTRRARVIQIDGLKVQREQLASVRVTATVSRAITDAVCKQQKIITD